MHDIFAASSMERQRTRCVAEGGWANFRSESGKRHKRGKVCWHVVWREFETGRGFFLSDGVARRLRRVCFCVHLRSTVLLYFVRKKKTLFRVMSFLLLTKGT